MQAEKSERLGLTYLAETLCDGAAERRGDLELLVSQHALQRRVALLTVRSQLRVRLPLMMATPRQRTTGGGVNRQQKIVGMLILDERTRGEDREVGVRPCFHA